MVATLLNIHGSRLGITSGGHLTSEDGQFKGVLVQSSWVPGTEFVVAPSPQDKSTLFDDFLGKTIGIPWEDKHGSDGAAVAYAINAQLGGVARGTSGANASADMAGNGTQLHSALNWEADKGGLHMEARLKISAITTGCLYIGFTDQVSSLAMPATLSGASLTTNLSNGCGFLFDTAATVANFKLVGVTADVDATFQTLTGVAPVAATFATYRVVIGTTGSADFYKDGALVGSRMTGATTATTPLTPVVAYFSRAASSRTVDIDYLWIQQNR